MMAVLVCENITKLSRKKELIKNFSYNFLEKQVYALVGKNDAGLDDLLALLANKKSLSEGSIYLDGTLLHPRTFYNQICYIDSLQKFRPQDQIADIIKVMKKKYPSWDTYYANELLTFFDLDLSSKINKLKDNQKQILIGVLSLASKADIIILNHPVEKVDIKARYDFFSFLYRLQAKYPRTFILTSTFIDEIDYLVDNILLIDKGKLVANYTIEELKTNFCYLTGKTEVLKSLVSGVKVIGVEERGNMLTVCIRQKLKKDEIRRYQKYLIKISEVPMQMIFIYLLNLRERKGIN